MMSQGILLDLLWARTAAMIYMLLKGCIRGALWISDVRSHSPDPMPPAHAAPAGHRPNAARPGVRWGNSAAREGGNSFSRWSTFECPVFDLGILSPMTLLTGFIRHAKLRCNSPPDKKVTSLNVFLSPLMRPIFFAIHPMAKAVKPCL